MSALYGNTGVVSLKLPAGWSGRGVASDMQGRILSRDDWTKALAEPDRLFENIGKTLKVENRNLVAVKTLEIGGGAVTVVLKRHCPQPYLRRLLRSFDAPKALKNFKTALNLAAKGLPVAKPLAALHQRQGLLLTQSILISEYIENAPNLREFVRDHIPKDRAKRLAVKKQLAQRLAAVLAQFHKSNLWHRDAKAVNFLVRNVDPDRLEIILVDMDGIKPYCIRRTARRFRAFWQLAASLMALETMNRTDYLRMFEIYCTLTDIASAERRRILRKLAVLARRKFEMKKAKADKDN